MYLVCSLVVKMGKVQDPFIDKHRIKESRKINIGREGPYSRTC